MKLTQFIYISTALAMLSACDDEEHFYTVGEADNAILLEAGVVDGGGMVKTRANWDGYDATRHEKHVALASDVKMQLRVKGTWKGHKNINGESQETIIFEPKATVGAENGSTKHNSITFSPVIYWDDFGTADPNNRAPKSPEGGREEGLTIFAAAYNKPNTAVPVINGENGNSWTDLSCSVPADQTSDWSANDLIISNNIQAKSLGKDCTGTLRFDDWKDDTDNLSNLLEFKHVMSKVTFILTAGKGFPEGIFEGEPTVQMHGFYTSGKVDVTNGATSDPSGNVDSENIPTNIETYCENTTKTGQEKVTRSALVFPGLSLSGSEHIATVTADGNIYKISAAKIYAAMRKVANEEGPAGPGDTMLSGYNYILKITVDKTEVHVEATVANWIDVVAEEDYPKIDVTTAYGDTGDSFTKSFSFYYSENKDYVDATNDFYGTLGTDASLYGADRKYNGQEKKFDTELFWPNHTVKYFFRGVWPETTTTDSETLATSTSTTAVSAKPSVSVFTGSDDNNHEGIYVKNMKYVQNTFPSDLLIGIPYVETPTTTGPQTEPEDGISATEGTITLNFTYRMAQVEVHILSSGLDTSKGPNVAFADNIDLGSEGGADQAKVEIVGGYTQGYVLLADGHINYAQYLPAPYEMTPKSTVKTGVKDAPESYADDFYYRHDAVVPQSLGTDNPLQFVITTGSEDLTYDTYKINIKDINVSRINGVPQSPNTKIDKWEAGKHYVYTLKITKTQIKIEAMITDWIPVVAGGDFWL